MSETPNGDANVTKGELIEFFVAADPEVIMSPEERKQLDDNKKVLNDCCYMD